MLLLTNPWIPAEILSLLLANTSPRNAPLKGWGILPVAGIGHRPHGPCHCWKNEAGSFRKAEPVFEGEHTTSDCSDREIALGDLCCLGSNQDVGARTWGPVQARSYTQSAGRKRSTCCEFRNPAIENGRDQ
jgi:hypothetical protein